MHTAGSQTHTHTVSPSNTDAHTVKHTVPLRGHQKITSLRWSMAIESCPRGAAGGEKEREEKQNLYHNLEKSPVIPHGMSVILLALSSIYLLLCFPLSFFHCLVCIHTHTRSQTAVAPPKPRIPSASLLSHSPPKCVCLSVCVLRQRRGDVQSL